MDVIALQTLESLEPVSFTKIIESQGYRAAACYRCAEDGMTLLIGSQLPEENQWPAFLRVDYFNYTKNSPRVLPIGWHKGSFRKIKNFSWSRSLISYFPVQDLQISKFVLLLVPLSRRKYEAGKLDGFLEALLHRISGWVSDGEMRKFIDETLMQEHTKKLGMHTQTLIDHELRTPLTNIYGYAEILRHEHSVSKKVNDTVNLIENQIKVMLSAIDKLDLTFRSTGGGHSRDNPLEILDIKRLVNDACIAENFEEVFGSSLLGKPNIKIVFASEDEETKINGVSSLLKKAIVEVIQNAIVYSQNGSIQVTVYHSDPMVVIDIEDNGEGVPSGIEELIFLPFFRGYNNQKIRRGHRGLGLGLYLARYIVEQHVGQLNLIRKVDRGSIFRFLIPKAEQKLLRMA